MTPMPWESRGASAEPLNQDRGSETRIRSRAGVGGSLADAIRDFNAATPLLGLFGEDVKRAASTNGGEFSGPCPLCQGDDRLRAWPTPCEGTPRAWCRQCNVSGDALHWSMRIASRDTTVSGAVAAFLVERGLLAPRAENNAPEIGRGPVASPTPRLAQAKQVACVEEVVATRPRPSLTDDFVTVEARWFPKPPPPPSPIPAEVKSVGAKPSTSSFLDIVESWCPQQTAPPVAPSGMRVVFVPLSIPDARPQKFGDAYLALADVIHVPGVIVQRGPNGRVAFEYPKASRVRHKHALSAWLADTSKQAEFERLVLDAMRAKGYLLAGLNPSDRGGSPIKSEALADRQVEAGIADIEPEVSP